MASLLFDDEERRAVGLPGPNVLDLQPTQTDDDRARAEVYRKVMDYRRGARGDAILAENSRLWREVENGTRDIGSAQSEILKRGIKEPEWWARRGTPGERWKSIDYGLSPKER